MIVSTPSIQGVVNEIVSITRYLVEEGYSLDQNFPVRRDFGRNTHITYQSALPISSMLKPISYEDLYSEQAAARSYNVRMIDGALLQMQYEFSSSGLLRSRLAFLPSPSLVDFQSDPELYMDDVLFAEVVHPQTVSVPVRFDYDNSTGVAVDILHPIAHLTLGQYKNCRVATTGPLTPGLFVGFLLRSFYNTASSNASAGVPCAAHRFRSTITTAERDLIHVAVP